MAEFDELISILKDLTRNVKTTQEYLDELKGAQELILKTFADLSELGIKDKVSGKEQPITQEQILSILSEISPMFPNILVEEISKAAELTIEYSQPILMEPLVKAAQDPENILAEVDSTGGLPILNINIDMDKSAGSLENWAGAVKSYRETLKASNKGKKQIESPIRDSNYWMNIVYNGKLEDLYEKTIHGRMLAMSGGLAPYWKILDVGNSAGIPLSSNRGGYAYPTHGPTRFTERAIKRMQTLFNTAIKKIKKRLGGNVKIDEQKQKLMDYYNLIQKLINDLESIDPEQIKRVKAYLDAKNIEGNVKQILKLIVSLQQEQASGTTQIGLGINTITGIKYRVRFSTMSRVVSGNIGDY